MNTWIIDNLTSSLNTWNSKLAEMISLLTTSPQNFKGGAIWETMKLIHGGLLAIGSSLLVIFFLCGLVKTCSSITDMKKPEHAVKAFVRFAIAKIVVTQGLEFLTKMLALGQGIISAVLSSSGIGELTQVTVPNEIIQICSNVDFWEGIPLWAVTFVSSLLILVLSFMMILTIYSRFFKIYLYTAISPIPLSTFGGQPFQNVGINFVKSYAGVCLEGVIIIISCIIFSSFVTSPTIDYSLSPTTVLWAYVSETIFNLLVLVGTVKISDRLVKEIMGL